MNMVQTLKVEVLRQVVKTSIHGGILKSPVEKWDYVATAGPCGNDAY